MYRDIRRQKKKPSSTRNEIHAVKPACKLTGEQAVKQDFSRHRNIYHATCVYAHLPANWVYLHTRGWIAELERGIRLNPDNHRNVAIKNSTRAASLSLLEGGEIAKFRLISGVAANLYLRIPLADVRERAVAFRRATLRHIAWILSFYCAYNKIHLRTRIHCGTHTRTHAYAHRIYKGDICLAALSQPQRVSVSFPAAATSLHRRPSFSSDRTMIGFPR